MERRTIDELFSANILNKDSLEGIEKPGFTMIHYLDTERVEAKPKLQQGIAAIFFDILHFLYLMGDTNPPAIGLATSIWQSMQMDTAHRNGDDLPDQVTEDLFNHPKIIQNPFKVLHFDQSRDGQYSQVWLINRVMSEGALWVGRYMRNPMPWNCPIPDQNEMKGHSSRNYGESSALFPSPAELDEKHRKPILQKHTTRQIIANFAAISMLGDIFESGGIDPIVSAGGPFMTAAAFAAAAECWDEFQRNPYAEEHRVRDLVSTFDVDGPCIVATPFNPDWETLPHPELRSMSVCWVLEPVQQNHGAAMGTDAVSHGLKTEAGIRPVSRVQPPNSPSMKCRLGLNQEPSDSGNSGEASKGGPKETCPSKPAYRVLDKVKGMWQIMDMPLQCYSFI